MPGPSIRSAQIISICTSWNFLEVKANQNTMHALPDRGSESKYSCPCLNLTESLHFSKVKIIQFCHQSRQSTTHARQLCMIIAPSEALNEWSPHHPHPCWQISTKMLTSASLISDPIYQKSRGLQSSKLPPLLRGGDQYYHYYTIIIIITITIAIIVISTIITITITTIHH